jgi:hypothetical protein
MGAKRDDHRILLLLLALPVVIEVGLGWTLYLLFWNA